MAYRTCEISNKTQKFILLISIIMTGVEPSTGLLSFSFRILSMFFVCGLVHLYRSSSVCHTHNKKHSQFVWVAQNVI